VGRVLFDVLAQRSVHVDLVFCEVTLVISLFIAIPITRLRLPDRVTHGTSWVSKPLHLVGVYIGSPLYRGQSHNLV